MMYSFLYNKERKLSSLSELAKQLSGTLTTVSKKSVHHKYRSCRNDGRTLVDLRRYD